MGLIDYWTFLIASKLQYPDWLFLSSLQTMITRYLLDWFDESKLYIWIRNTMVRVAEIILHERLHYGDAIMRAMVSQIIGISMFT